MDDLPFIIPTPAAATWVGWYKYGLSLNERFPGQDADQFAGMLKYNPSPPEVASLRFTGLRCEVHGEYDESNWVWVVTIENGAVWRVDAGCDYTGWDCRSWAEWQLVSR